MLEKRRREFDASVSLDTKWFLMLDELT